MGIFWHVLLFYRDEGLHQTEQHFIFRKAVYEIKTGLPAADLQRMIDDVEVFFHIKKLMKIGNVFLYI